jgi:ABC-type nitrate/sulfonate/bicarbonate transport system substrate-binding protein
MRAEGIDLQTQVMPIAIAMPAIISGGLDIASVSFEAMVLGGGAGGLVVLDSEAETPIYTLVGGQGVRTLDDLREKPVIASSGPTSSTTAMLKKMLAARGVDPALFQLLNTGGTPDRYAALFSGQVGGALLTQPFDVQAAREGLQLLIRSSDIVEDIAYTMHATPRAWLDRHRDVAVRFLRAVVRANRWLYDPANRAEAEAILGQETGADADLASSLYDLYLKEVRVYRPDAAPVPRHLQGTIDLLIEVHAVEPPGPNPEEYLELGPLNEALASLGQ